MNQYASIEDALYDPSSTVTVSIDTNREGESSLICVAGRGRKPEVMETTAINFDRD